MFGSAGNPVEKGIVASLARPGGNVTGVALHAGISKALELLTEAVPGAVRVAHVYDPSSLQPRSYREVTLTSIQSQAAALRLTVRSVALRDPDGVPRMFEGFGRDINALVLETAGLVTGRREQICGLAVQRKLPAIGRSAPFSEAGCLASYGENLGEMYRRAAIYVDQILKGTRPGDLPVEQATKFDLVVNLKTARALGLTIPRSLLLRADQVIE